MNNPNMQQNGMQQNRASAGLHHFIQHYRIQQQQGKVPNGWQQSTSPEERGQLALQFFTQYRLLKSGVQEVESMRAALTLETQNFMTSTSKEEYIANIKQKLIVMTNHRQQQMQSMQGGVPTNMNNMGNPMNAMNAAQMNMMGQMGHPGPRQGTPQQFNPSFPNAQLQRPMQVSPVPMTQGQSSMGMNGANPATMNQGQNTPQPNMQPDENQRKQQEAMIINQFARKLMEQTNAEIHNKFKADIQSWPEEKKQQLRNSNVDPLFLRFRQHAEMLYRRGALNPKGPNQKPGAMQGAGQPNLMQGQQMNMNQRQPNQDYDLTEIANRQMEALRSQEQGNAVVPASNNPNGQMGGFPGQNPQPGQAQNAMAQREAFHRQQQAQAQAQAQAQQAQVHAQAHAQQQARLEQQRQQQQQQAAQVRNQQNQMLQGQIGGLNLPQGSQQPSPAMPMLNRPMPPPGQAGSSGTPQQQRPPQAHVPIMTPQPGQPDPNLSDLMRQAQQRAAAVSQATQQPLTEQVRMNMMPADLDPNVKQQLLKVPEHQFRTILQGYLMNVRKNNMQNGAFPPGQPNGGQVNMLFNQQQQQQQLQPGMSGQMLGGPNMPNMIRPGMNFAQQPPVGTPQPPMGGQRMPMQNQQQRLAAASQMLRQNPGIIHATDSKPFPPNVLNATIRSSLPPDVRSWQQLKVWASQNPALVPGVDPQKLLMLQVLHFQDMVRQSGGQLGVHPGQQPGPGLAPPAQVTPAQIPARTPQQQQNMQNMAALQPTIQEIQAFRMRIQGTPQANISDDQVRGHLMQMKMRNLQQHRQQQQQQQQQHQQLLNQQAQRAQGQQQQPQPPPVQQHAPNRPPTAQPPVQVAPQPKAAAKPLQPPQPAQSHPTSNAGNKGTKRPNEDTAEPSTDAGPHAPAMASSRSQTGLNLTQEQMSKLTPAQAAQYRAQLLKAQDASNSKIQQQRGTVNPEELRTRMADPARHKQFKQMVEEAEKSMPSRQPIPLPQQARAALQKSLRENIARLKQLDNCLRLFHASYTNDTAEPEAVVRQIARSRALLFQQMSDDGTLHAQVTMTLDEFKAHLKPTLNFVAKITEKMKQSTQGQSPAQQPQGSTAPPAQLNAANLKIVEQQQRHHKAPSAPTTDRPPFAIGADSGHGVAHYFEGARPVTNLVLPEKKRAKLEAGSQTSTPTGAKASPRMPGTGSSPELRRQPQPQIPQRPTFRCNDPSCEYSVHGFETQPELQVHSQIHTKIEDPMQFALQSMAEYCDVDQKTGEPKVDPNAAKRASKPAPAPPKGPAQNIKAEHTPSAQHNAPTPAAQQATATAMARVPTQTGIKDSPSSNLLKTPQTMTKVATPGSGARGKATPASISKPAPMKEQAAPVPEPPVKEEEEEQPMLPMSLLDYSYEDTFAALDAKGPFTVLDLKDEDNTWALRSRPASPSTTPESSAKDTPSTRQSDISENDNLMINLDLKDTDMPDSWVYESMGGVDVISEDFATLGVVLPPMDSEDLMLFPDMGGMMDLDMLERTMDSMPGLMDVSVL
jgi:hypothetical protein